MQKWLPEHILYLTPDMCSEYWIILEHLKTGFKQERSIFSVCMD